MFPGRTCQQDRYVRHNLRFLPQLRVRLPALPPRLRSQLHLFLPPLPKTQSLSLLPPQHRSQPRPFHLQLVAQSMLFNREIPCIALPFGMVSVTLNWHASITFRIRGLFILDNNCASRSLFTNIVPIPHISSLPMQNKPHGCFAIVACEYTIDGNTSKTCDSKW